MGLPSCKHRLRGDKPAGLSQTWFRLAGLAGGEFARCRQSGASTAWASLNYTIAADVTDNGKLRHVDGGGLGTAILEKRSDGWRIGHWHSSAPRRAPAPPPAATRSAREQDYWFLWMALRHL